MKNREVREVQEVIRESVGKIKNALWNGLPNRIRKKKPFKINKIEDKVDMDEIKSRNEFYFNSDGFSMEGLNKESRKIRYKIIKNETEIKKLDRQSKETYDLLILIISVLSGVMIGNLFNEYLALEQSSLPIVNIIMSVIIGIIVGLLLLSIYYYFLIPYFVQYRGNNRKIKKMRMENIELEIRQEVIQEKIYSIIQFRLDYTHNNDKEVEK